MLPKKLKEVKTWRLSPPGVGCCWKKPVLFRPRCQRTALPHSRPSVSFARDKPPQRKLNAEISHAVESCQVISRHLIWHGWIFRSYALWAAGEDSRGIFAAASSTSRTLRPRLQGCKVFAAAWRHWQEKVRAKLSL